jgi:hypothetical protein
MFFETYSNFLKDETTLNKMESVLSDKNFPWFYFNSTVEVKKNKNNRFYNPPIIRHCFVIDNNKSNWYYIIDPLLIAIATKFQSNIEVINAHANLMMPCEIKTDKIDIPHIDLDNMPSSDDFYTAIFYIRDSDGYTTLYNQTIKNNQDIDIDILTERCKIYPEKNKLVVWQTPILHSGPGSVSSTRVVINLNFKLLRHYN